MAAGDNGVRSAEAHDGGVVTFDQAASPLLDLHDLTVRYGTGSDRLTAVDGLSVSLPRGGTLGLVGESGSGKSTAARAIVGLVPVAGGSIVFDGEDVTAEKARAHPAFRKRVQMVFQDPFASLNPRMTVGETLGEALAVQGRRSRSRRRQEALEVLDMVGLSSTALERYPHEFSGGQRQRVAIARALSVRPDLIIMDEVTSALDVSVQATILNLLKSLQRDLGLSYLFISHDLAIVDLMSESIAVLYLGRLVEAAPGRALFSEPRHPYTKALIGSIPRLGTARRRPPLEGDLPDPRNPPPGCRFSTRCPIGPTQRDDREICVARDPQAIADDQPHRAACHFAGAVVDGEPTGSPA